MKRLLLFFISSLFFASNVSYALDCVNNQFSRVQETFDSEESLILALKINGRYLQTPIEGYYANSQVFLPAAHLALLLGIDLSVETKPNYFEINTANCNYKVNKGIKNPSSAGYLWIDDEFDLYLSEQFFAEQYAAIVDFDQSQQLIKIDAKEINLPDHTSFAQLALTNSLFEADIHLPDQYHLVTSPVVDYRIKGRSQNDDEHYSTALNAYHDFLYHEVEWRYNYTGNNDSVLFKMSREFSDQIENDGDSFWNYQLGDIISGQNNLISQSVVGSGFIVNKNHGVALSSFSTINIEETVLPDWRAELYRNGMFLAGVVTNSDNLVLFSDIELFYGENRFEIRLFGPNGEKEIRYQNYNIDNSLFYSWLRSYVVTICINFYQT